MHRQKTPNVRVVRKESWKLWAGNRLQVRILCSAPRFRSSIGRALGWRPRQYWFNSSRNHHKWGMGMLGVFTCLASRNADGFKSHILHQKSRSVAQRWMHTTDNRATASSSLAVPTISSVAYMVKPQPLVLGKFGSTPDQMPELRILWEKSILERTTVRNCTRKPCNTIPNPKASS